MGTGSEDVRKVLEPKKDEIARSVPEALELFRKHVESYFPRMLAQCTSPEQKAAEIAQTLLEAKFADLTLAFFKSGQKLTASVMVELLAVIHNREEGKMRSIGISLELLNSGILEMLEKPEEDHVH